MKKYMRKNERGLIRPVKDRNGNTVNVQASTMHMPGTGGVWRSNNYHLNLLSDVKPLLDRTHTPRGALRAITLERNYAHEKWLYNKKDMDEFDPRKSKRDLERSKTLKRISRRQDKQRTLRQSMISTAKNSHAGATSGGIVSPRTERSN